MITPIIFIKLHGAENDTDTISLRLDDLSAVVTVEGKTFIHTRSGVTVPVTESPEEVTHIVVDALYAAEERPDEKILVSYIPR